MIGPNNPGPERAFPSTFRSLNGDEQHVRYGMELRDYFAAKAMQAYLAHDGADHVNEIGVARWAYEMADAMLKAREA